MQTTRRTQTLEFQVLGYINKERVTKLHYEGFIFSLCCQWCTLVSLGPQRQTFERKSDTGHLRIERLYVHSFVIFLN